MNTNVKVKSAMRLHGPQCPRCPKYMSLSFLTTKNSNLAPKKEFWCNGCGHRMLWDDRLMIVEDE